MQHDDEVDDRLGGYERSDQEQRTAERQTAAPGHPPLPHGRSVMVPDPHL
jgi:hypothetical protein